MTMRPERQTHDRLMELLADRAVGSLSDGDARELETLSRLVEGSAGGADHADEAECMDLAAAAIDRVLTPEAVEPMPAALRARIIEQIERREIETARPTQVSSQDGNRAASARAPRPASGVAGRIGWVVAMAACLALVGVTATLLRTRDGNDSQPVATRDGFDRFASTEGVKTAQWSDWDNPERAGVGGSVAWSEAEQTGLMRFEGLPVGEPATEQYQLWIIDERGLGTRVSGAIFDAQPNGATVVRIEPAIHIRNAAAFAVTIEHRGGVWVSDMSRRVVIATLGG